MKNNIMYYYNIRIDNITQNNNNYYFTINNDNYCFTIYTRDIKESNEIYKNVIIFHSASVAEKNY